MTSRPHLFLRASLAVLGLSLATPARAETPPRTAASANDASFIIDELIVTGSRIRSSANVFTSVDAIGADQIERQSVDNAWELLGRMPGVLLTDFNQGTTSGKFSFRGFNGEGEINAVKLLIDGIPSNSNDGNMPFIDMVFPLELESIETVRGTTDPRWGIYNIAGSADMRTRTGGDYLLARLTGGSYGTAEAQVAAGAEAGGLSQNYMAAYRQSNGYRDHAEFDRVSAAGKWFYALNGGTTRIGAIARYAQNRAEEPGYLTFEDSRTTPQLSYPFSETDGGRRHLGQFSLHLDADITDELDASAKAYVNRFKDRRWVQFSADVAQQERIADEWHWGGVAAVHYTPSISFLHGLTIEGGGDFQIQENESLRYLTAQRERTRQTRDQSFDFDIYGGYVQAVIEPVSFLKIVPAYRIDVLDGSFRDGLTGGRYEINDYGVIDQPKLSAALTPIDGIVLYGNWGRTFQTGVGSGAYKVPPRTADLEPSTNEGWEAGVKLTHGNWVETRLAYWEQTASGEVRRRLNDPLGDFDNLGRTKREGIDAQINLHPWEAVELWLAYAWQRALIVEPDPASPATRGNRIDHVPAHLVSGGADVQVTPSLRLSLWGNGQSSYYLEQTNTAGQFGDYVLLHVEAAYRISESLEASIQVKNLTNTYYEYVWWDGAQSLHSPGDRRAVYGTLGLRF